MDKTLLDSASVDVVRLKRLPVAEYANIVSTLCAIVRDIFESWTGKQTDVDDYPQRCEQALQTRGVTTRRQDGGQAGT